MTTKIITNTIVTTGYTLSSAYSALSITSTGTIEGAAGAAGVITINSGRGGNGGYGLSSYDGAAIYNAGLLVGGRGGDGAPASGSVVYGGPAGSGRAGALLVNSLRQGPGGTLTNSATIAGGTGGNGGVGAVSGGGGYGGQGGHGAVVEYGPVINNGTIMGGMGGVGGAGGRSGGGGGDGGGALSLSGDQQVGLNDNGVILGGEGGAGGASQTGYGGRGGAGGFGLDLGGGTLTFGGTITGGQGGESGLSMSGTGAGGGRGGVGAYIFGGVATNYGTITGGTGGAGAGGKFGAGGAGGAGVALDGTLINDGTIIGGAGGAGPGQAGATGNGVSGGGILINQAGGLIIGQYGISGQFGRGLDGTVTNFGTIEGTGGVSAYISGRLIAEAGSTFIGEVQSSSVGTLELGSGTGTITGLGRRGTISGAEAMTFTGFGAYVLDAGSAWTLTGTNATTGNFTLAAGAAMNVAAGGKLNLSGRTTILDGTLDGPGSVHTANVTLDGLTLGGAGLLVASGTVDQTGAVTVGDASPGAATLELLKHGVWDIGVNGVERTNPKSGKFLNYGELIKNTGTGISTLGVTTYDDGLIEVTTGTLDVSGALYGTGSLVIGAGATLETGPSVNKTLTVTFAGSSGTLGLATPKTFAAIISGFTTTDRIDLLHIKATLARLNASDQLEIYDGPDKRVAVLQLTGTYRVGATFIIAADGEGGTDITMVNTASVPPSPSPHLLAAAMAGLAPAAGGAVTAREAERPPAPILARPGTQIA